MSRQMHTYYRSLETPCVNLVERDFDPTISLGSAIAREMEVEVAEEKNSSLMLMTSRGKASRQ